DTVAARPDAAEAATKSTNAKETLAQARKSEASGAVELKGKKNKKWMRWAAR
ncbi:hypothetical protein PIB30_091358, partial [Stylosanthes scabra]|nr:hypothetical protein [Stylosanthes scabra]